MKLHDKHYSPQRRTDVIMSVLLEASMRTGNKFPGLVWKEEIKNKRK
jgi:hypothetical protein